MRVKLVTVPHEKKIQAIKGVRAATGLGLKEAKDAVDSVDLGGTVLVDIVSADSLRVLDDHGVTYQSMHVPLPELVSALRSYPQNISVGDLVSVLRVVALGSDL